MESYSHKPLLFLLGLVLGLLAGAGFFIFKMDELLKKINFSFLSKKDTVIIQQQIINPAGEKKGKTEIKKYIGHYDTSTKEETSAKIFAQKYSKEMPVKKIMAEADSLLQKDVLTPTDTLVVTELSENLIIKKDKMLATRNIQVINLQQSETSNSSDSLLEKISGIKDEKKNIIASFKVEFWQSPINYKGYKMSKNKIVLFGIPAEENIMLYHKENTIFMKHEQTYYKLYFTDDFKQFEKVKTPLNFPEEKK